MLPRSPGHGATALPWHLPALPSPDTAQCPTKATSTAGTQQWPHCLELLRSVSVTLCLVPRCWDLSTFRDGSGATPAAKEGHEDPGLGGFHEMLELTPRAGDPRLWVLLSLLLPCGWGALLSFRAPSHQTLELGEESWVLWPRLPDPSLLPGDEDWNKRSISLESRA